MIDRSQFNAEDFLVDNTFQLYCSGTDPLCIEYWEKYIKHHPEQETVIMEAKRLYVILSGNKRQLNTQLATFKNSFGTVKIIRPAKSYIGLKIAAAILMVIGATLWYRYYNVAQKDQPGAITKVFNTKSGERKNITLPDGSKVQLNARSTLSVCENFNEKERVVVLKGEAFFDVAHNANKPFKVHTDEFNIHVLGTAFNVKAYPDESSSEATLIRGVITMEAVHGPGGIITLKPSQKVTFYKPVAELPERKALKTVAARPEITINHYTVIKDSTIVETAWTKNKIEIYDQNFDEIKDVLEKWFNVEIKFADPGVGNYRFTATFGEENIEQVMEALQKVEHFKYEIKGKKVLISK